MKIDVALASCLALPEPDPDQALLMEALACAGVAARVLGWDDPAAPWDAAPLVVVRSTWNYHHRLEAFLGWVDRVERLGGRLENPAAVLRWNTHKSYLRDLAARGLPTVPTAWIARGPAPDLAALLDERGWRDVVLKPQVSAGSFATHRLHRDRLDPARALFEELCRERDMMLQPYQRSVDDHGERALIWIDGELTHAVRKSPRFAGGHESVSPAVPIAADERELALRTLASGLPPLLYARADLARSADGTPQLMELELVEPSLFLRQHPPAAARLAAAIRRRLRP